jgi:hypothetical protein
VARETLFKNGASETITNSIRNEKKKMEEVNAKFKYERDTKRFHRFNIVDPDGEIEIGGTVYIAKGQDGIPKRLVLKYEGTSDQ